MKKNINSKRPGTGDVLQQSLEDGLSTLPVVLLEHQISRKLKQQGIEQPRGLAREIAEHVLSGKTEPFIAKGAPGGRELNLTIDDSDIEQLDQAFERFRKEQLPALVRSTANGIAKSTLKDLKTRWPDEQRLQEADLVGFRARMESRWGKPLGQLRMLLTISREWCQNISVRESSRRKNKNRQSRRLLIRLLVRGCQVADEILCLLENGFADGAMARWRTLHEIAVVAAIILQHGDEISQRYLAHQHVESKRAMDKYLACSPLLGYKPLSVSAQAKIQKAYDHVIATYGKNFKSSYGWAAFHLKKDCPTFADLEDAAGRAAMRSYYQMSNDNIHAGIKSMYFRLGLLGRYEELLAGRSNVGLTEPGQNTAHTLTQLAVLVCLSEPIFNDCVIADMLTTLRDGIPRSFARVDIQIQRADKAIRNKLRVSHRRAERR